MDLRTQAAEILMGLTGSDEGVAQLAEDKYRDRAIPALLHLLGGARGPGPLCARAALHPCTLDATSSRPGHSFPYCLLVCRVTPVHTRRILIPGLAVRCMTVCSQCRALMVGAGAAEAKPAATALVNLTVRPEVWPHQILLVTSWDAVQLNK